MGDFLISGATLVSGTEERQGSLRISDGAIAEILPPETSTGELARLAERHGCEVVDGSGCLLIPGGVDPHVHFALATGGGLTADDFVSGSQAALAGGTTTVIDFITPGRDESLVVAAESRLEEAAACACDYSLHQSVTHWGPDTASQLEDVARKHGLSSIKIYLAYLESIGLGLEEMTAVMAVAANHDWPVLVHCEDGAEIARRQQALLAANHVDPDTHPLSRPPAVEETAVHWALAAAEVTGCRPYLVHLSTEAAVDAVLEARSKGQTVVAETCPQYLLLEVDAYAQEFSASAPFIMSPPLRDSVNRQAVARAVLDGTFDVVASDHCSFNQSQKEAGKGDFTRIPGGVAGVEHRLALLHTLAAVGGMSQVDWVRLVSEGPARTFGLYPRKGSLDIGADADLVLWDPVATRVLSTATDHHRADHLAWEGTPVRGRVMRTWLRGEVVVENDLVMATSGNGRLLVR